MRRSGSREPRWSGASGYAIERLTCRRPTTRSRSDGSRSTGQIPTPAPMRGKPPAYTLVALRATARGRVITLRLPPHAARVRPRCPRSRPSSGRYSGAGALGTVATSRTPFRAATPLRASRSAPAWRLATSRASEKSQGGTASTNFLYQPRFCSLPSRHDASITIAFVGLSMNASEAAD